MSFAAGVGFANCDLLYSGIEALPREGEEVYANQFAIQLGGGVPATMINLSRLGVPCRFSSFFGTDIFSAFVKQQMEQYRIAYYNLYRGEGQPVVVTSVMVTDKDRTFMSYKDPIDIDDTVMDAVYEQMKGAKVVEMHLGFLPVYERLKKEGTILVMDVGWDEALSLETCHAYMKLADYFTPNQKEAMKITDSQTVEEAADKLGEYFDQVIIKLDKDGCLYQDPSGVKRIPPMPDVVQVDSTGAGDAFLSGFMYGLYHDYPLEDCILFGNITGGTCVQGVGCLTSYVMEEELLALAEQMKYTTNVGNE